MVTLAPITNKIILSPPEKMRSYGRGGAGNIRQPAQTPFYTSIVTSTPTTETETLQRRSSMHSSTSRTSSSPSKMSKSSSTSSLKSLGAKIGDIKWFHRRRSSDKGKEVDRSGGEDDDGASAGEEGVRSRDSVEEEA